MTENGPLQAPPRGSTRPRKRWVPWVAIPGALAALVVIMLLVVGALPCPDHDALLGPAGVPVAFLIGVVSFFSPCILPLLPGYLSFVSGLSGEEMQTHAGRRRVLAGTVLFVLGFAVIFTGLGASASAVGGFLNDHLAGLNRIAGGVVILIGISFMLPSFLRFMEVERRPLLARTKPGVAGSFPLGMAFAFGWIPCVSPGLGVLLTLGLAEGSVMRGAILLFFFSLGFGIWFILSGLAVRRALVASRWVRARARVVQAVGGVFMVALGVLLVTDQWGGVISPLRRLINSVTTAC